MNLSTNIESSSVNAHSPLAISVCSNCVYNTLIKSNIHEYDQTIILCVGSDRSTGDSLGPLVGYKLKPLLSIYKEIIVTGTLDDPVHAKNLEEKIDIINKNYTNPFIIAIDASLGQFNKIGYINIKNGPLRPGLGVNKKLPHIGHISITGVVNVGGMMEYVVLQNTRLSLVMKMAEVISRSIFLSIFKYYKLELNSSQ